MVDGGTQHSRRWFIAGVVGIVIVAGVYGASGGSTPELPEARNVVVIGVDRLSPFRMSCYGNLRNTTPFMCSLADEGILFENAFAQTGWTAGSIASLFTGVYPSVHEVVKHGDRLPDRLKTIAEVMNSKGYETAAFPANRGENRLMLLPRRYNLDQGFDTYAAAGVHFRETVPAASSWLADHTENDSNPFFLFVQGFEMHKFSYTNHYLWPTIQEIPGIAQRFSANYSGVFTNTTIMRLLKEKGIPESQIPLAVRWHEGEPVLRLPDRVVSLSDEDVSYLKAYYDASARYIDNRIRELVAALQRQRVYENTAIVVTSSHGESIVSRKLPNNRLFSHGQLYEGSIHVPLIVHIPGYEGIRYEGLVQMIDVAPSLLTVLDIADKAFDRQQQGKSFAQLLAGRRHEGYDAVFSEGMYFTGTAVRTEDWKLIDNSEIPDKEDELFRVTGGRTGEHNLAADRPEVVSRLQEKVDAFDRANTNHQSLLNP